MVAMLLNLRRSRRLLIGMALLSACCVPAIRSALGQAAPGQAPHAVRRSDAERFVDGLNIGPLPPQMLPSAMPQPAFLAFEAPLFVDGGSPNQLRSPAPSKVSKPTVRLTPSLMRRIASALQEQSASSAQTKKSGPTVVAEPAPADRRIAARIVSQKAAANAVPDASSTPANEAPAANPDQAAESQKAPAAQPAAESDSTSETPTVDEERETPAESFEVPDPHMIGTLSGCAVRCGVMCGPCDPCAEVGWDAMAPIPWESLAHGEYIGPARLPHVPEYRLRVDDVIEFVYRLTRTPSLEPYRINVGDTLRIESLTAESLNRDVIVQPDGTITVGNISQVGPDRTTTSGDIGQVPAAGRTIEELRNDLIERYKPTVNVPSITVTPISLDSRLEELRATVDARAGAGGQGRLSTVTPEGTVQLPAIGSVPAQGLTLDELKFEIEQRYNEIVAGLEITPILSQRAPRFIYVTGEVRQPGRYELEAPTTLIQAIALAGSWNVGADLENIVILRRDENWQLMATQVDLHYALFGRRPCPAGEIWLRDSDIVLLPKHPLLWTDDLIELLFTRGLYGMFPVSYSVVFNRATTL